MQLIPVVSNLFRKPPEDPPFYSGLKPTAGKVLDFMGVFQKLLIFGLFVIALLHGISNLLTAFHVYTPDFYCADNGNKSNNCDGLSNGKCPGGFLFDDDDETIVVEFQMVCDRQLLAAGLNGMYFLGLALGALLFGILSDKYGRKPILMTGIIAQTIAMLVLRFASILTVFMIIRMIQGFLLEAVYVSSILMIYEIVAERFRATAIIIWHFGFVFGTLLLIALSYAFRHWHHIHIALALPGFLIFCYAWAIPESVNWYIATNRQDEALNKIFYIAKNNKDEENLSDLRSKYEREFRSAKYELNEEEQEKEDNQVVESNVKGLCEVSCLWKFLLSMSLTSFVLGMCYYTLGVLYLSTQNGGRHLNFTVGAVVELVSLSILIPILKQWRTRKVASALMLISGFFLLLISVLLIMIPEDYEYKDAFIITITMINKAFLMAAYASAIFYICELFPTILRGTAFGICDFFGRIGCGITPFFIFVLDFSTVLVLSVSALSIIVMGALILFLPDLFVELLPQSLGDAKELCEDNSSN